MDAKLVIHYIVLFGFYTSCVVGQSEYQKGRIKANYNQSRIAFFNLELEKRYTESRERLSFLMKSNKWVFSDTLSNGNYIELLEVGPDGTPLYYSTFSDNVSHISRANALYRGGVLNLELSGEGMEIGVWDSGTSLTTHQEFATRVFIGDESKKNDSHATKVMGVLLAAGLKKKAKGVAYKAIALTNDWRRDKIEVSKAAANGLLLSNHSYGIKTSAVPDWYFGAYIKTAQDWDKIMYNAPYYLMVVASGNSQKAMDNEAPFYGGTVDGYDLLLGFSTSKNGVTVAAVEADVDTNGNLKEAIVANYSSFGPMDDSRIKPDIAGGGTNVFTTAAKGNTKYTTSTGTSMATPGVTGSMLLLQEYYESLNETFMKAATLKGLVLHTADDVNQAGPDYKIGWGVINTKKAAETILNREYSTIITERDLANGETYSITINANENENLLASISWTDPASENINKGTLNDPKPVLVNDLDIRITKEEKTYYPWKLNASKASSAATKGDNKVDPFEKIRIENASGAYSITVSHKGNLLKEKQNFSIIVTGIAVTQCNVNMPVKIYMKEVDGNSLLLEWQEATDTLFEVQFRNKNINEWTTEYNYNHFITLPNLTKGSIYEFRLRAICTQNIRSDLTSNFSFIFKGKETKLLDYSDYESVPTNTEPSVFIYPNPAVEEIKLEGNIAKHTMYTISNTAGILIETGEVIGNKISVADMLQGLYILRLQDLNGASGIWFFKR